MATSEGLGGGASALPLKPCPEPECPDHQWAILWDGKVVVFSEYCRDHDNPRFRREVPRRHREQEEDR